MTIQGSTSSDIFEALEFHIDKCDPEVSSECAPAEEIDDFVNKLRVTTVYVGMQFDTQIRDRFPMERVVEVKSVK